MKTKFKKALFLHITSSNKRVWEHDLRRIKSFKHLDAVEIWLENNDIEGSDVKFLKSELAGYDIIIHAPFINMSLISSHKEINQTSIEILKKTIDIAKDMDAKLVTIHGGAYPIFMDLKEVEDVFVQNFAKLMNYAHSKEVNISIENISKRRSTQISYPVMLADIERIAMRLPDILFTLDVGHCTQNNDDYRSFLRKNINNIKNIHLHNGHVDGSAHFGFNKKGDLDLQEFLNMLTDLQYENYVSLEVLGEDDIRQSWDILINTLT